MTKRMLVTIIIGVTVLIAWTVIIINEESTSASPSSTTISTVVTEVPEPTTTSTTSTTVPVETRAEAPQPVQQEVPAPKVYSPPTDGCWMELARQVGWPEETLGHLHYIIQRESRCDPSAYANRPSTMDNSRGLLQINSYGSLDGVVRRLCGIEPERLFDPEVNLTCGLAYYQNAGWRPWGG